MSRRNIRRPVAKLGEVIKTDEIQQIRERVDYNSDIIDDISKSLVKQYCANLDQYVKYIDGVVADTTQPATTEELEDFVLNLPTLLFFAGGGMESLGIQEDTAKAIKAEKYNEAYALLEGTIADKQSAAELAVQSETLVHIAYQRAYKMVKQKMDAGYETLSSVKKVLTKRIVEMEMKNSRGNNYE